MSTAIHLTDADRAELRACVEDLTSIPHDATTHDAAQALTTVLAEPTVEHLQSASAALDLARLAHASRTSLDYWLAGIPAEEAAQVQGQVDSLIDISGRLAAAADGALQVIDGYLLGATPAVHRDEYVG